MRSAPSHAWKVLLLAVSGVVSACSPDAAPRPATAPHAYAIVPHIGACDNWCPIAMGRLPFSSARFDSDSIAFDVRLASLRISVRPGGSAALRLEATNQWWAAIPDTAILYITVDGVRRRVALGAMRQGLEVAHFSVTKRVELQKAARCHRSRIVSSDTNITSVAAPREGDVAS